MTILLLVCVFRRDNYGFVTFLEPDDARVCIERTYKTRNYSYSFFIIRSWFPGTENFREEMKMLNVLM
jgi:hypothetical protein